jgi:long-subunit fatty acid transport protein
MKKFFVTGMALLCSFLGKAQTDVDALRYSRTTFGGTSRAISMGGAFGALGGDFSTLSINPAGIGVYRRSEVSFSPSLYFQNTASSYIGATREDTKYNFNFSNAGLVYTFNNAETGWINFNFGFGYNRTNNFNNRTSFQGINPENSLMDNYLERLNAGNGTSHSTIVDKFPTDIFLAYDVFLIDTLPGNNMQYGTLVPKGWQTQARTSTSSGSMGDVVFTFGANYNNQLYLGATLAFCSIDYSEKSNYDETDERDSSAYFKSFRLTQDLNTSGSGFNLKLGAIYRLTDWVRIGASYHTPSVYSLSDIYTNTIVANYDQPLFPGSGTSFSQAAEGLYDYQLTTPSRLIGSLAFIIGKRGILSGDLERVNYATSRFSSEDGGLSPSNDAVRNKYREALNLRIGGEYRINDIFSARLGYAYYGTPYKSAVNSVDAGRRSISGGFGIRGAGYFVDLSYVVENYSDTFVPYSLMTGTVQTATNKFETNRLTATVGFKF